MTVERPPRSGAPFLGIENWVARRSVFIFYVIVEVTYLVWRFAFTIWGTDSIYAWLLLLAEVYVIANATWFYLLAGPKKERREPPIPTLGLTVDVFITTFNEDVSLVRTTAIAARDMDYPHETWILDDGRRPAMREMAAEVGVGYITRPTNEHFKAGNMNNALGQTSGDLVLVLDADHIPRRSFLTRLVGYFEDPNVSLVQTPQIYYNVGSYQHRTSTSKRLLWHEGRIFQHRIMAGAERAGCAFFIGTGGLLRRSALEEIGGFALGSVTEDIYTSMRLHAKGYRSVFVDEPLGFLQAPQSPHAYSLQRLRWAQGGLQILRRENPLFKKGLTLFQRIAYFNSLSHSLAAFPNLLFYLAPALYLLFALSPINAAPEVVILMIAGHLLVNIVVYKLLAAPDGRVLESSFFKFVNMPIYLRSTFRLIFPKGLAFRVTPKGRQAKTPAWMWILAAGLTLLHAAAIAVGGTRILEGELNFWVAAMSLFFSAGFVLLGLFVLRRTFGIRVEDEVVYVSVNIDTLVRPSGESDWRLARLERLGPSTAVIDCPWEARVGDLLQLDVSTSGLWRPLSCRVTGSRSTSIRNRSTVRLDLVDLDLAEQERINGFLFNTALPTFLGGFVDAQTDGPPPEPVAKRREQPETPLAAFTPGALPAVGRQRSSSGSAVSITGSYYRIVAPPTSERGYPVVTKPVIAAPRAVRPLVWVNPRPKKPRRRPTPSQVRSVSREEAGGTSARDEAEARTGRQPRLLLASASPFSSPSPALPEISTNPANEIIEPSIVETHGVEPPVFKIDDEGISTDPRSLARVALRAVTQESIEAVEAMPPSDPSTPPRTPQGVSRATENSWDELLASNPELQVLLAQYLGKEDLKN